MPYLHGREPELKQKTDNREVISPKTQEKTHTTATFMKAVY